MHVYYISYPALLGRRYIPTKLTDVRAFNFVVRCFMTLEKRTAVLPIWNVIYPQGQVIFWPRIASAQHQRSTMGDPAFLDDSRLLDDLLHQLDVQEASGEAGSVTAEPVEAAAGGGDLIALIESALTAHPELGEIVTKMEVENFPAGGELVPKLEPASSPSSDDTAPEERRYFCAICSAPATQHYHFGARSCHSCRAFFRRSVQSNSYTGFQCKSPEPGTG